MKAGSRGKTHSWPKPSRFGIQAAPLVRIEAIVADGLLVLRRDVADCGSDEIGGGKDLEVALGAPTPLGAVNNAARLLVPGDLLQGKRGPEQILGQSPASPDVMGGDGFLAGIEAEATMFPAKKLAGLFCTDEFLAKQGCQETVPKEFGQRLDAFHRHEVKAVLGIDETGGGEDVEVGMENKVIAEGLHGGNGSELTMG